MKPGLLQEYYVGLDLGQKRDYSVVALVLKKNRHYYLEHLKQFSLRTEYSYVLEYLTRLGERFQKVRGYFIDQTGVGEVFVENARKHGLSNVKGVVLTMPMKQEVMTCLKQVMEERRLHIPRDRELINVMNGEIAELTEAGKTKFHHRSGTHDDKLWALALAVYGARHDVEQFHPVILTGKIVGFPAVKRPDWTDWVRKLKPGVA